jgi:hypothetical protein
MGAATAAASAAATGGGSGISNIVSQLAAKNSAQTTQSGVVGAVGDGSQGGGSQIEELSSRVGMLESNSQDPSISQGGLGIPGEIPQQTTTRPMPSNQMGSARPVFNEREMGVASQLFSQDPQQSLGDSAPMFDVNSSKYNNQ